MSSLAGLWLSLSLYLNLNLMDLRHAQLVSQLDSARSEYEAAFRELQALFTAVSLVQHSVSDEDDENELVYRTVDALKSVIAERINKAAVAEQGYAKCIRLLGTFNDTDPAN